MDEQFLTFFYGCVFLAGINNGKYEDKVIYICRTSGDGHFEIERKANNNPVVYARSIDPKEVYRTHGEWVYLSAHVAELVKSHVAVLGRFSQSWKTQDGEPSPLISKAEHQALLMCMGSALGWRYIECLQFVIDKERSKLPSEWVAEHDAEFRSYLSKMDAAKMSVHYRGKPEGDAS